MKLRLASSIAPVALVLCAFLARGQTATAPPAASAEPSKARLRSLADQPPAAANTAVPTPADWQQADEVALARPLPVGCHARLVREWLRLRCDLGPVLGGSGAVLAGSAQGVSFFMTNPDPLLTQSNVDRDHNAIEVVMPLRPGDRRLVQLTKTGGGGYAPTTQDPLVLVSEIWLAGDKGPVITTSPIPLRISTVLGARFKPHEPKPCGDEVVAVAMGSAADKAGVKVGQIWVHPSAEQVDAGGATSWTFDNPCHGGFVDVPAGRH